MNQSDDPELMLSQRERLWMRVWFWAFYLLGPLTAVAAHAAMRGLPVALPAPLGALARMMDKVFGIWAPMFCGAMCAAYCLARLYGRRSNEEVMAFTILIGVVLTVSYFVLLFAACLVASLLFALGIG
jgi:hypothetical protein